MNIIQCALSSIMNPLPIHSLAKQYNKHADLSTPYNDLRADVERLRKFYDLHHDTDSLNVLKHFHYSFAFYFDYLAFDYIVQHGDFQITVLPAPQGYCGLLTGSLLHFRQFLLTAKLGASDEIKQLIHLFVEFFLTIKYSVIWEGFHYLKDSSGLYYFEEA